MSRFSLPPKLETAVINLRGLLQNFSKSGQSELKAVVEKLSFADLNRVLYRCDQEERDDGHGFDVYDIPAYGKLVYAGLQGMRLMFLMRKKLFKNFLRFCFAALYDKTK